MATLGQVMGSCLGEEALQAPGFGLGRQEAIALASNYQGWLFDLGELGRGGGKVTEQGQPPGGAGLGDGLHGRKQSLLIRLVHLIRGN